MIKDISGLILYILSLGLVIKAPVYLFYLLMLKAEYIDSFIKFLSPSFYDLFSKSFVITDSLIIAVAFLTIWLPVYVTNIALDKKWSRYINLFYEKILYSTAFLLFLIILQLLIKKQSLTIFIIFYFFIYVGTVLRKFFKKTKTS